MKTKALTTLHLIAFVGLSVSALGQAPAAATPTKNNKPTPDEILAKGIVTTNDFRNYLVATGKWTWEIGKHRDQTIKFNPDGTALHTELVMKYSIDSIGVVTVRHPNGHSAKITFSKDFKSYEGAWDKTVPLTGTRVKQPSP